MIKLALIEDDRHLAELERNYIEEAWSHQVKLLVEVFYSAEAFLKADENGFDILVADIELPGISGIELGRKLRRRGDRIAIIFLTAHDRFALESYELEAEHYILKSQMKQRIARILNELGKKVMTGKREYRMVSASGEVKKLYLDDIIYFYKEGKYVRFITPEGEVKERVSMEAVFEELGGFPFIRIERGYIINAHHMVRLTDEKLYLDNKEALPVSRRFLPQVKQEITRNRSRL